MSVDSSAEVTNILPINADSGKNITPEINEDLPPEKRIELTLNHLDQKLRTLGFELPQISDTLRQRLLLLEQSTPTILDARTMMGIAEEMFLEENFTLTNEQKRNVLLAIPFADIGKSGPADATTEQSDLVISMYSIEGIEHPVTKSRNPKDISIETFFDRYFPEYDINATANALNKLGFTLDKSMRDFYDRHATWSHTLLRDSDLPPDAIVAAVSHHRIQGDNPDNIYNGEEDTYRDSKGKSDGYGKVEKLVTILDVYDALRRRSKFTHEKAMGILNNKVKTDRKPENATVGPYADEKDEFWNILKALDAKITKRDPYTEEETEELAA